MSKDNEAGAVEPLSDAERLQALEKSSKLSRLILYGVAGVVVLLLVVVPYLRWLSRTYTVTTRRVIARSGLVRRTRTEMGHARGYTIAERRGPIQRLWGAGTLTLTNGVDAPLRMVDIPAVRLMNETLADQVEVSQILAHRDSHAMPVVPGPPPPLPPDL